MKRTTVFLQEDLQREVSALAKRQARPAAALVREAIGLYLVSQNAGNPPSLGFLAVGASGRTDTAESHEDLLFEDLSPHGETVPRRGRKRAAVQKKGKGPRR
jgi:predicted transcriptional regulator